MVSNRISIEKLPIYFLILIVVKYLQQYHDFFHKKYTIFFRIEVVNWAKNANNRFHQRKSIERRHLKKIVGRSHYILSISFIIFSFIERMTQS